MKAPFAWNTIVRSALATPKNAIPVFDREGLNIETLEPLAKAPRKGEPYGRSILVSNPEYEVMLAQWAPDAQCAAHDHGASKGIVWLVSGEFVESRYTLEKEVGLVHVADSAVLSYEEVLHVTPGEIHSMRVIGPALSLHIYAPAIHAMKVYDPKLRRTITVTDDCGAWVPKDLHQIIRVEKWT